MASVSHESGFCWRTPYGVRRGHDPPALSLRWQTGLAVPDQTASVEGLSALFCDDGSEFG